MVAGADNYILTYQADSGNVDNPVLPWTGSSYNDLPSTEGRTVTSTVPTANGATFEKWKVAGKTTTYNTGAEVATSNFTYDGTNQVCNLVATWKRNIVITYDVDAVGTRSSKSGRYTDGNSISIPFPSDASGSKCFRGWSSTAGAEDPDEDFSDVYDKTSVNVSVKKVTDYDSAEDAYVLNLYAVWGDAVKVTYVDDMNAQTYVEYVNPEGFKSKNITKRYYDMTWNTEQDGSGRSYSRNVKITDIENYTETGPSGQEQVTLYYSG